MLEAERAGSVKAPCGAQIPYDSSRQTSNGNASCDRLLNKLKADASKLIELLFRVNGGKGKLRAVT